MIEAFSVLKIHVPHFILEKNDIWIVFFYLSFVVIKYKDMTIIANECWLKRRIHSINSVWSTVFINKQKTR